MSTTFLFGSYFGTNGRSVWRYDGPTWTQVLVPTTPTIAAISTLRRIPNGSVFAADENGVLYRSDDDGLAWTTGGSDGTSARFPIGITEAGRIYALHAGSLGVPYQIRYSDDLGLTWTVFADSTGASDGQTTTGEQRYLWAANGHVYWNWVKDSLPHSSGLSIDSIAEAVAVSATVNYKLIPRGTYDDPVIWLWGLFDSPLWRYDGTLHAITLPAGEPLNGDTDIVTIIPVGAITAFLCYGDDRTNRGGRIWRTTDAGASWIKVLDVSTLLFPNENFSPSTEALAYNAANPSELAAVAKGGFYHSTDNGDTWAFVTGPNSGIEFSNAVIIGGRRPSRFRASAALIT